jgi:hypothetical protein
MTDTVPPPEAAPSRHAAIAQAFETFGRSVGPFIDRHMAGYFAHELDWAATAANRMGRRADLEASDPLFQLLVLRRFWGPVFADPFGEDLRGVIGELIEARNRWAHLDLPDDPVYLERCLLGIERIVAPVDPLSVASLRALRTALRRPADGGGAPATPDLDVGHLAAQLSEAEAAFETLQGRHHCLLEQLESARRAAAARQLHLISLEQRLEVMRGRSAELQRAVEAERDRRSRVEWLFVGLIAVLLLLVVLAGSLGAGAAGS